MRTRQPRKNRKGSVLVLSAVMMVVLVIVLAFAVDLGYLCLAQSQLQRSADAAAIAGAWELIDEGALTGNANSTLLRTNAESQAGQYARLNNVLQSNPSLGANDVAVGYLSDLSNGAGELDVSGTHAPNAVRVQVKRTADQNGEVPFFLAKVLGLDSMAARAEATAVLVTSFRGFRAPADGGNVDMLPFALDVDTWIDWQNGVGADQWRYNAETKTVVAGTDTVREFNLYPQGTGSPGNRGTVDIGSSNNSTCDIARQIVHGISPADLAYHGGELKLDESGQCELNGDTGISAGVKDELTSIIGQKRMIPIFSEVVGPGNNAQYTIIGFEPVLIMEVRLTGAASSKRVMVQPTTLVARGGIPSPGAETSHFIYSPVWLLH